MRLQDIKTFIEASMNLDVGGKSLKPNEFRHLKNFYSKDSKGINIPGNTLINNPNLNEGIYRYMGSAEDYENEAFIFCLQHIPIVGDAEHSIYRYFYNIGEIELILKLDLLNFQAGYPLKGANVIGGLFYWTDNYQEDVDEFNYDNYNPPRKINIAKAIHYTEKGYSNGTIYDLALPYSEGDFVLYRSYIYMAIQDVLVGWSPTGTTGSNSYWQFIEVFYIDKTYFNLTFQILDRIKYPPLKAPVLSNEIDVLTPEGNRIDFIEGMGDDIHISINNLRGKLFQFRYRYGYDDKEKSRWSAISEIPYPEGLILATGEFIEDETLKNVIGLDIETGSLEVVQIEIAVRIGNYGHWKLVERIYKYNIDNTVNTDYKSNDTITWCFYNSAVGETLDQKDTETLYDDIAQVSGYQELIEKNRLIDSNYIKGYDPVDLDVELSWSYLQNKFEGLITKNISTGCPYTGIYYRAWVMITGTIVPKSLYTLNFHWCDGDNLSCYSPDPYYENSVGYIAQEGDNYNDIANKLAYKMKNQLGIKPTYVHNNLIEYHRIFENPNPGGNPLIAIVECVGTIRGTVESLPSFKSGAWHSFGLVYYDRANRSSYVNTNNQTNLFNPYLTRLWNDGKLGSNITIHKSVLNWQINHKPPYCATHYSWMMAKNSVEWFLNYLVPGDKIVFTPEGDRIEISLNAEMQLMLDDYKHCNLSFYDWQKGDRIRFLSKKWQAPLNDHVYLENYLDFEILSIEYPSDGGYQKDDSPLNNYITDPAGNKLRDPKQSKISINAFNKGSYFYQDPLHLITIEVYRPRKSTPDEETKIYCELGEMQEIINPHTEDRNHAGNIQNQSATQPALGKFERGDVYIKGRNSQLYSSPVESMWYSDFYDSEAYGKGRPNIINRNAERKHYKSNLCYGGMYIQDTQVNDLSKFNFEDYVVLAEKFGEITRIQEIGYTLKVRQVSKSTSIYIGRAGLEQAEMNNQKVVVGSDKVLGTHMVSPERWGCINSESCVASARYEYFVDVNNGVIIRDAPNGMFCISKYGIRNWVKNKCKYLTEDCSEYNIYGGFDGDNEHIYFTFIGLDKSTGLYNIETIIFNEDENKWICFIELLNGNIPMEGFGYIGQYMFSFMEGKLYRHNINVFRNYFYGNQYKSEISFVVNNDSLKSKVFKSLSVYSNKLWSAPNNNDITIPASMNNPNGMSSKLPAGRFVSKEGIHYAPFGKNMITSGDSPSITDFVNGNQLRGEIMEIKLTNDNNEEVELTNIIIDSIHSKKSGVKK